MKKFISIAALIMCGTFSIAYAQTGHLNEVRILNEEIKKNDQVVDVNFTFDLTDVHVGTQNSVRFEPVIVALDDTVSLALPALVVDGKIRNRVHNRAMALNNQAVVGEDETLIRRKNGQGQLIDYAVSIPYQSWMSQSRLVLRESLTGCAECDIPLATEEMLLKTPFLHTPVSPVYITSFSWPAPEPVKARSKSSSARLNFRQDKYNIDPNYRNNRAELDTVFKSINLVKEDRDLTITGIYVTGYASPEGGFNYNINLSKNRANAFAEFVQQITSTDKSLWHIDWKGEDWEGLRVEVLKHPLLLKIDEVLAIIDNCTGDRDVCEQRLRQLTPSDIYKRLLNEMYPPLRRNDYRIEYSVRNFNVEEARQLLKTRPDLLSLSEMYQVAGTYKKGTPEYNEVIEIAARTYPDRAEVWNNHALADMENGDIQKAISRLEGKVSDAVSLNTLGVAYAKIGRHEDARQAFQKAIDAGSEDARQNMEVLSEVMAN